MNNTINNSATTIAGATNRDTDLNSRITEAASAEEVTYSPELTAEIARLKDKKDKQANTANLSNAKPTPHSDSIVMNKELTLAGLGEELGKFKAYDSQLTIPEITGTRVIKCLYQVNVKTRKKLQENSYVRIPCKHLTEEHIAKQIAELSPHILSWVQSIEDLMIRGQHKKGSCAIYTAGLSLDKIVEHLEATDEGNRLNKEKIEAWYVACVEEELAVLFATKMGLSEDASEQELEKLELILQAYKTKFASLAGGKTIIKDDDCKSMIAVINGCEKASESLIGNRFIAKLEKMMKKENESLISLL